MATSAVKRRPKLGLAKTSGNPSTMLRTDIEYTDQTYQGVTQENVPTRTTCGTNYR